MRPHQHILDWLSDVAGDLHTVRHDIHAHPELGFEENRTSALVAKSLREWGYEVHTGIGKTGVVGVLRNGSSPRTLGIRADIKYKYNGCFLRPISRRPCGGDSGTSCMQYSQARAGSSHQ